MTYNANFFLNDVDIDCDLGFNTVFKNMRQTFQKIPKGIFLRRPVFIHEIILFNDKPVCRILNPEQIYSDH